MGRSRRNRRALDMDKPFGAGGEQGALHPSGQGVLGVQTRQAASREVAVGVLCGVNGAAIKVVVPQAPARQHHLMAGGG